MDSIKYFNPKTISELNQLLEKLLVSDFNFNIIINLDNLNDINFLTKIYKLLNLLKKNKKSLVVVSSDLIDKQVNVVPTLLEAYDIIELEEIERDLLL
ncbi:MAG: ribonuclease Z [Flavobacteriaceae bacterium]|nr:ribonuclease Z [Flavobacteriaceae bacterium]